MMQPTTTQANEHQANYAWNSYRQLPFVRQVELERTYAELREDIGVHTIVLHANAEDVWVQGYPREVETYMPPAVAGCLLWINEDCADGEGDWAEPDGPDLI